MSTSTSCSSYTCPVYGNLPNANLQGLPPIPLCCFGQGYKPCQPLPSINVEREQLCICDILPVPEGFNLSYLLVNLPTYLALLLSAVPRWLACMIYDVGIALRDVVLSIDDFISAVLDLFLAIFIGFAEGASIGGCYIVSQIANFLFHANIKLPNFGNNCPFCYTLNQTLQSTLETVGFALGTPIGLINLVVGLLLDSVALILCYLANLTVNFGICVDFVIFSLNASISFSPFSFLGAITPFNCGCILGQLGVCPVLNLTIGCNTSANCDITNSNCQCLATQGSGNQQELACQSAYNSCTSTVIQWAKSQYSECQQNYANAVTSCSTALSTCLSNASTCYSNAVNNCQNNYNTCKTQASTSLESCLANASTSLQNCLSNASTQLSECQNNCYTQYSNDATALANCYAQCQQNYASSVQYCESHYATSESECQNNYASSTQQCQSTYNSCVNSAQQCLNSAQACCQNAYTSCVTQASASESACESTVHSTATSNMNCCQTQYSNCSNNSAYNFGNCYGGETNVAQQYAGYNYNCSGKFNCGG